MLSGQKGVKYGLQLNTRVGQKKQAASREKATPRIPSIFGNDDDTDDIEAQIARQASRKNSQREVEKKHAEALEQDPNVFDYDGVYDDMKGAKDKPLVEDRRQRESKYIARLLHKAEERQRDQDLVYERQLAKERAKEDHLYGDKEKFVTRAYREKLAEQQKLLEDERRREALEAAHDVTKKGDLSDFYRNLLNKNEAFGAKVVAVESPPPPATAALPATRGSRHAAEELQQQEEEEEEEPVLRKGPSAELQLQQASSPSSTEALRRAAAGVAAPSVRSGQHGAVEGSTPDASGSSAQEEGVQSAAEAEVVAAKPDTKSTRLHAALEPIDAVSAARERYLARKKQRT
eukprot:jgi/Mesen1/434/ME001000S10638